MGGIFKREIGSSRRWRQVGKNGEGQSRCGQKRRDVPRRAGAANSGKSSGKRSGWLRAAMNRRGRFQRPPPPCRLWRAGPPLLRAMAASSRHSVREIGEGFRPSRGAQARRAKRTMRGSRIHPRPVAPHRNTETPKHRVTGLRGALEKRGCASWRLQAATPACMRAGLGAWAGVWISRR
jgi:hypothetical protein